MSTSYLLDHEAEFPGKVERGAASGQIDKIYLTATNLAMTEVRGIDAEARFQFMLPDNLGRMNLQFTHNRLSRYAQANAPDAPLEDTVGYYLRPKERNRFGLAWDRGVWQFSLNWNHTGAYMLASDSSVNCSYASQTTPRPDYCRVKSWLTADAYLGWRGVKDLEVGLSVRNVDDAEAPFDADRIAYLQGFNPAYHNQLGRYFQMSVKYKFW